MTIKTTTHGKDHPYSNDFSKPGISKAYEQKFNSRIDQLRHLAEEKILAEFATGRLLDCSVATGRFVEKLPRVESYTGLDYSQEFLDFVSKKFPNHTFKKNDLLQGIALQDDSFETVICIRTLFALGRTSEIVGEMKRVAKRGGTLIFDYGNSRRSATVGASKIDTSSEDIEKIIRDHSLTVIKKIQLDSISAWVKKSKWLAAGDQIILRKAIPTTWLEKLEHWACRFSSDRTLYVVQVP